MASDDDSGMAALGLGAGAAILALLLIAMQSSKATSRTQEASYTEEYDIPAFGTVYETDLVCYNVDVDKLGAGSGIVYDGSENIVDVI